MAIKTQIHSFHKEHAHIVEFSGFDMPLWYRGIVHEVQAVRTRVGMFDVSHMGRALISGEEAVGFLDYVTPNTVSALTMGQGHYSVLCNQEGGIKDDIVIIRLEEKLYLMVFNAANREKDLLWMNENLKGFKANIKHVSDSTSMFAVQGPKATETLQEISSEDLSGIPRFGGTYLKVDGLKGIATRTGYTGEDGFEVFTMDASLDESRNALKVWNAILEHGKKFNIEPCGLGARDVLRLEAGMCLYGHDITESTTPFQARIGWVVKLEKERFIGKESLAKEKTPGPKTLRVGLKPKEPGIPREECAILKNDTVVGKVTSGTFSPTLNQGIAMGYVPKEYSKQGETLAIQVRQKRLECVVTGFPFYDNTRYGWQRTGF
ncbi:MAG: glycine cleavage system aminomethyltransferase GcvT [archaeon]